MKNKKKTSITIRNPWAAARGNSSRTQIVPSKKKYQRKLKHKKTLD